MSRPQKNTAPPLLTKQWGSFLCKMKCHKEII